MSYNDQRDDFLPHQEPETDDWFEDIKIAAGFLTRVPLPHEEHEKFSLSRAMRTFPIVGALAGLSAGIVLWLALSLHLPANLASLVAVFALIALTGGLHEDGLADTADGFWGGATRERKLAIMRDSRLGTFGFLALLASVLMRIMAIEAIVPRGILPAMGALIAAAVLSRHAMVALMATTEPARSDGLAYAAGRPSADTARLSLFAALILAAPALWVSGGILAIAVGFVLAGLAYAGVKSLALRHVAGYTGDTCGALQQVTEVAVLVGLAAVNS